MSTSLTEFSLRVSAFLDRLMSKENKRSPDPIVSWVLHEHRKHKITLTVEMCEGEKFRVEITRVH